MRYRFVVRTAHGLQNFLSVEETNKGDLVVTSKGRTERIDLASAVVNTFPPPEDELEIHQVTVHPNLQSQTGTISVNYKTIKDGKETREVTSALDVKEGDKLFPALSAAGVNVMSFRLTIDPEKHENDRLIELWPNQSFDWSIESLAYCFFVANPNLFLAIPQNFPRDAHSVNFTHLQVIFLYWTIDKPTKGASIGLGLEAPPKVALLGLDFRSAVELTDKLSAHYLDTYDRIPALLPGQLPDTLPDTAMPLSGVKIAPLKWHFSNPTYRVSAHRDESLLRVEFIERRGNVSIVDFNGEAITKFQDSINHAIREVPGLAVWKKPAE